VTATTWADVDRLLDVRERIVAALDGLDLEDIDAARVVLEGLLEDLDAAHQLVPPAAEGA
jgi:hypothetical protein